MRRLQRSLASVALAVSALGFMHAASATPVSLDVGSTLTVAGIDFSVTQCQYTTPGGTGACGGSLFYDASGTGPGAGIKIYSSTGPIFTAPAGDPDTYDLAIQFQVTSHVGDITRISAAVFGSASLDDLTLVGGGETVSPGGLNVLSDLSAPGVGTLSTPLSSFLLDKDFGPLSVIAAGPDNLVLDYLTQNFETAIPEPASITAVMVGLIALVGSRRRVSATT
jgi:hypothetical protein